MYTKVSGLLPLLPALAVPCLAQSTSVVDLVLPLFGPQTILASVVRVMPSATVYDLACPEGEDETECGLATGVRVTEGPSTVEFQLTSEPTFSASVGCVLDKSDATCTQSVNTEPSGPETSVLSDYSEFIMPVTITAGLERLSETVTATGTGAGTGTGTTPPKTTKLTGTVTPTGTAAGTGSSGSSTAGVAGSMITQNAVLAGVAAVVGGAMVI